MKFELLLLGVTGFTIINMYYDGYYGKLLLSYKKYYGMAFVAFIALCFYLMVKRNPGRTRELLLHTNNAIKYMPIDRSSIDLITPIFDFTSKMNADILPMPMAPMPMAPMPVAPMPVARPIKRAVSETKKKYVASMQGWKCAKCGHVLTYTFEIDHKIRLEHGGGNDVGNLMALCRECHGQKTAMENM